MNTGVLRTWVVIVGILAVVAVNRVAGGDDPLVVHEWGTFTSLQDENGKELSGINTDDEPVPAFVHNLNRFLLSQPVLTSQHWRYRQKGAPRSHPQVTMRLETPVIYFYPPKNWSQEKPVDVSVRFQGGWLTEFYPQAKAEAPGLEGNRFDFGDLTAGTSSRLTWDGLRLGTDSPGPATDQRVWLEPRKVPAANLRAKNGESERYLFYRGVAHIRAPLRAMMDRKAGQLTLHSNFDEVLASQESQSIPKLWLVDVRTGGECAFRTLPEFRVSTDTSAVLARTGYRFEPGEFQPGNRERLAKEMHAALTTDGLTSAEATALLETWQKSYFISPGLRLFYLVPRAWTEHYLPLTVSHDSQLTRVMVGRLELVGDDQRALLTRLAQVATSDGKWVEQIPDTPAREKFMAGRTDFGDLGVAIPPDYQMYLHLGRFRNALVAYEERVRPTVNLTKFIDTYGLHPFRIPLESKTAAK